MNLLKSWIRPSGESISGAVMSAVVGGVGVAEVGELLLLEGEKIYIVNDRMTKNGTHLLFEIGAYNATTDNDYIDNTHLKECISFSTA